MDWDKQINISELKDCPFCGSRDLSNGFAYHHGEFFVHCNNCDAHIESFESVEKAVEKWNKRSENNE